jgi:drug/metabolite transporter (DMT)-like permease
MVTRMSFFIGVLLMCLSACSFGAAAILIKLAYRTGLEPSVLLPLQNLAAILCLWPILLTAGGLPKLERRQALRLTWQGLIGNFGISICFYWSAQRIDISLLTIILFTYPAFVLLYLMIAERHRITSWECLSLLMALAGGVLASDPVKATSGRIDGIGILLAVGAAIAYAFTNVYGQKLTNSVLPLTITTVTCTVSTLAIFAVCPPHRWFVTPISGFQWLLIVGLALLSTVLPVNLMYLGIRRIGAFHASIVSIVELPCILILAYFILGERISSVQTLGAVLILLSLIAVRPAREST